jgi:hypothetical protein
MKMDTPNGSMISAIYVTQDSKEQVLAFYKDKFGSGVTSMDFGNVASLTLKKSEDEVVQVTITTEESDKDGKTKFTILHTKKLK